MRHLHELLEARREDIIREVDRRVRDALTTDGMPLRELENSLPRLLDELTAILARAASGRTSRPTPMRATAVEHGVQRLRVGFSVESVVREYDLVVAVALELAEAEGLAVPLAEVRALVNAMGVATVDAVREYQRQRDAEQARLASEHLGFLAHELRNPLSSARAALALLRKTSLAEGGKAVDALERNLSGAAELINHALAEQRLRAAPEPRRERVDLLQLLSDLEEESAVDVADKGLRLSVHVEPGLGVDADPRLLRSVVANLLRNAVKFSREGGEVALRAHRGPGGVRVEVEDSCGGIGPAAVERLFDPFVQAHRDRSGFGLGLAIAREAAEAHGGTLQVQDLIGKGCVFILELPTPDLGVAGAAGLPHPRAP